MKCCFKKIFLIFLIIIFPFNLISCYSEPKIHHLVVTSREDSINQLSKLNKGFEYDGYYFKDNKPRYNSKERYCCDNIIKMDNSTPDNLISVFFDKGERDSSPFWSGGSGKYTLQDRAPKMPKYRVI